MSVKRIEFLRLKLVNYMKIKSSCRIQGKKKIEKKTYERTVEYLIKAVKQT